MRRLCLLVVLFCPLSLIAQAASSWKMDKIDDALHGQSINQFTLFGDYLVAPKMIPNGFKPTLIIQCVNGRVTESFINFGAVLDVKTGRTFPVMMESRIDGKRGDLGADNVSTDGMSAYFPRSNLRSMLKARTVIVGANEFLGPEVTVQFDIPDVAPVLQSCGSDRMLRKM